MKLPKAEWWAFTEPTSIDLVLTRISGLAIVEGELVISVVNGKFSEAMTVDDFLVSFRPATKDELEKFFEVVE